jgi:hypothetical protein
MLTNVGLPDGRRLGAWTGSWCVCLECTSLAIKIASILSGASPLVGSW